MNKNEFLLQISILLSVTFILRILTFYFFGDTHLENEWKILVHNLTEKGTLGYFILDKELNVSPNLAGDNDTVLPSAFMPPLYAYFIFVIKYLFSNFVNFVSLVIFFQIILSTYSSYLFYKIIRFNNNKNFSFYATLIFSLIPINVYAASQISSISIQLFFLIYFFYILKIFSIKKKVTIKNLIIFSIVSGCLILFRGEFILFFILTLFYFFIIYLKEVKFFFITIIFTMLVVSPYLVRNFYQFNTFTITKSLGYNLLKGNNPDFKVEGNPKYIEDNFNRKNLSIKIDNSYEINLDNFYKQEAIKNITSEPLVYFKNYLLKVFSFIFLDFNSSYENYFNIFHILPKLVLSIFSLFGAIISLGKKGYHQYLSLYFFSNIFFFSIFFILPRYSLILLPIQILLSIQFIKYLNRKFFN